MELHKDPVFIFCATQGSGTDVSVNRGVPIIDYLVVQVSLPRYDPHH
jgi:hypothetical protein